MVHFNNDGPG